VSHHVAQCNIVKLTAPLDAPSIAGFVAALEPINALADVAPGFVWRLHDESGNATNIRVFDDDQTLLNLSVWESIEALTEFVYRSGHLEILRNRREWAAKVARAHSTLWWIPVGTLPTANEAVVRLGLLDRLGPSAEAFTFQRSFAPPEFQRG
jgi:hypothetical protein